MQRRSDARAAMRAARRTGGEGGAISAHAGTRTLRTHRARNDARTLVRRKRVRAGTRNARDTRASAACAGGGTHRREAAR